MCIFAPAINFFHHPSPMNLFLSICLTIASLLPKAGDAFWRDSIPEPMRQSYVQGGERYLSQPWSSLPLSVFAEFKANGNRQRYEQLNFAKRRQLAMLVMAEIMEQQGRFLPDIVNGLGSLCEETWWGLPAHYDRNVPIAEEQTVDLFNAETASLVAWTRYMLEEQLNHFSPSLCQRIDHEIERRILVPALATDYWWKSAAMNWNPWICSNWLACLYICEHDEGRKAEAISQIHQATLAFVNAYPDDGGCDEGPTYWDRAAASVFEVLRLLALSQQPVAIAPNGQCGERFWQNSPFGALRPKISRMAAYAYNTYIGNDYCVNFADAHENRAAQQVNIVYPFGRFIGDKTLCGFGAYLGQRRNVLQNPAALYEQSGNFPSLGRELFFLRLVNQFLAEKPREPLLGDVWMPDLQVMTARRGSGRTPQGQLFVAIKGGHNGESHNHNDVGAFIVYADSVGSSGLQPLFIDPGVGEYTRQTFSDSRYDIWTMQSAYHNLPQINGIDQKDGSQYCARIVSYSPGLLTLDIAGAYPPEAAVRTWKRTVSAGKHAITITENYDLSAFRQPTRLMLLTVLQPVVGNGTISLGTHRLCYDPSQLSPTVEDISARLDPVLLRMWGPRMYRIVLTVKSNRLKNEINYTICPK